MEIQNIIALSIVLVIALGFFGLTAVLTNWLKRHIVIFNAEIKEEDKKAVTI